MAISSNSQAWLLLRACRQYILHLQATIWVVFPWNFAKWQPCFELCLRNYSTIKITCVAFYKFCASRLEPSWNKVFSLSPCLQPTESGGAEQSLKSLDRGEMSIKKHQKVTGHIQEVSRSSYSGKVQSYWSMNWELSFDGMKHCYTLSY